jgi:lysophospholipase L1-like esterase
MRSAGRSCCRRRRCEHRADSRAKITELNKVLADLAKSRGLIFLDIGNQLLASDGSIPTAIMSDYCHPTERGYAIWAEALKPHLEE